MTRTTVLLCLAFLFALAAVLEAADWPHWQGIDRNGRSPETGLLKAWPEGGPKLLWVVEGLGRGYSAVAVANGGVYLTGMTDDNSGVLYAVNLDGTEKWQTAYGPEWDGQYPGARSTPTVNDGRIYIVSGKGTLICFDAANGNEQWQINADEKFNGKPPKFGFTESVLIDGQHVIFTPGGFESTVVALDKITGRIRWETKSLSEQSGYCCPVVINHGGNRLILTMSQGSVLGIDAETGANPWRFAHQAAEGIHPISPLYHAGHVYAVAGYESGGMMIKLSADGLEAEQVWTDKKLDCHTGGVQLIDGHIYGTNHAGKWICLNWKSGEVVHELDGVGKSAIIFADGLIYAYTTSGRACLIKPSPQELKVISSFEIPHGSGEHIARPVIAHSRLYIRHGDALMAYDIKQ